MKVILVLISTFLSSTVFAQEIKADNSITIQNLSSDVQQIWVNAVSYNVSYHTALRVPCNSGESIEVQHIDKSVTLSCGSKKELK